MRILLANEARGGAGGVETYLASLVPLLEQRGHEVAGLFANPASDRGPTRIVTREWWSVADEGLDRALAAARAWRPDVCFSHNMGLLDVDERLSGAGPTFKLMHGYFGTCVSGQKSFSFPALEPCSRKCGAACLAYYLPRRCGHLRPDVMITQYAWARRQQGLFTRYAGIVVASDHMRREYLRYGVSPERIHTIPLFAAIVESAAVGTPPIDVLFLGRMTPTKGAEAFLRAVRHAGARLGRQIRAVLAGDGPERPRLESLAREWMPEGTFTAEFPGWVDPRARAALLARATLVGVPSIWPEPFGLVGLEAAHFGVPAVAFGVGGIGEWLKDDVNGLIADYAGGPLALGDAMVRVLRDPALHARLALGARRAAAHFTAERHVVTLERVLSGLGAAAA